jgi:hypothetical protein
VRLRYRATVQSCVPVVAIPKHPCGCCPRGSRPSNPSQRHFPSQLPLNYRYKGEHDDRPQCPALKPAAGLEIHAAFLSQRHRADGYRNCHIEQQLHQINKNLRQRHGSRLRKSSYCTPAVPCAIQNSINTCEPGDHEQPTCGDCPAHGSASLRIRDYCHDDGKCGTHRRDYIPDPDCTGCVKVLVDVLLVALRSRSCSFRYPS